MSQWYLSKNGQALGPFDEEKLNGMIEKGELNHLDLVYRAGDSAWQPLAEIESFAELLKAQKSRSANRDSAGQSAEWVVLKKFKGEKGSEYQQMGPFTQQKVLELLDEGAIRFVDFAWKKGFESWVRIAEIEEFAEPLPSSPNIDPTLYEKSEVDIATETQVDVKAKASMTEMVKIERYDHEKTRVASSSQRIKEQTEDIPLNNEEFATESNEFSPAEGEDFEVNLWSLEPPSAGKDKSVLAEGSSQQEAKQSKSKKKAKPASKAKEKASKKSKPRKPIVNTELLQWAAMVVALITASVLFYFSFRTDTDQSFTESQVPVQAYEEIEVYKEEPPSAPVLAAEPKVPMQVKKNPEPSKKPPSPDLVEVKTPAPPVALKEPPPAEPAMAPPVVRSRTPVVKKIPVAVKPPQSKVSATSKKASAKKDSSKKAPAKKEVKATKPGGAKATGTYKAQSYYRQRDRKALFYSSLKAEKLAVEIENNFEKLQSNPGAWGRYYGQWRKQVQSALAKELRQFPRTAEKYAYPEQLAAFKKDYDLFYLYGEGFNAKMKGARAPSNAPKDMRQIFARWRQQAKSLGL